MKRIVLDCKSVSPVSDICWNCLHFDGERPSERRCEAFSDGIPLQIWEAERNHDAPYPNDNGIRFKHFESEPITSQAIINELKQNREQTK